MHTLAQSFIEECDDAYFCEKLITILSNPTNRGIGLVYEDWVLARLRLMRARAPGLFFGQFLAPLRTMYPGQVVLGELTEAMRGVAEQPQTGGGDVTPKEFMASMDDVFTHGHAKAHETGWHTLSPYYRVRRGEFTTVTGIGGHMKSTFVHSLCLNMAKQYGWNFSIFNPEHHPLGELGGWLTEAHLGEGQAHVPTRDRQDAMGWVADHFHIISPPDEVPPTLDWLLAVARLQKQRYGIDGVVLDPWNEIDHCYGTGQSETQYVSECLSKVRRFARTHNVHVWIVAHPTKLQKAVSGDYAGQYPPPTPYDISGGAHWYNKSDACVTLWRDAFGDSPIAEVHIYKVRNRAAGKPGKIQLQFDGHRFRDIGSMAGTSSHWTDRN